MVCVWGGGGSVWVCVYEVGKGCLWGWRGGVCVWEGVCVCVSGRIVCVWVWEGVGVCVWEGVCVCLCLCVCVVGRGCLGAGISHSGGEGLNTLAAEISLQSTL